MTKNRRTVTLAGILGGQLVLASLLWLSGSDHSSYAAKEPLLKFDSAKVDGIQLDESGANSVSLKKQDGKWIIPSMAGFPADSAKVDSLLSKLAALKKGWPSGTTSEAEKRFKVTEDVHERRIILKSGDKTAAELLLGTSPTFRQTNARNANESKVYSVAFATYDAGTRGEDWMDRSSVDTQQDQIASISVGGVTIDRKDANFDIPGLAEGEKPNETAIWRLVGAVTRPAFDAVQGKGEEALAKVKNPDIEVTVKRKSGPDVILRFKKEADGGGYLFTRSNNDFLFRVAEGSIEPIVKAKREELVVAPKSKDGAEASTSKGEVSQPPKTGG